MYKILFCEFISMLSFIYLGVNLTVEIYKGVDPCLHQESWRLGF